VLGIIARRYIFSSKRTKAINIISWISIGAIAVGAAALIIVLSSYNGIDAFVKNLYTSFYTDVKVSATRGNFFADDDALFQQIRTVPHVISVGKCLEEKAMLTNGDAQQVAVVRGIDQQYEKITKFKQFIKYGDTVLSDDQPRITLGISLANTLRISENAIAPLILYAFTGKGNLSTSPQDAYTSTELFVSSIFAVQEEFDSKYAIVSIAQAQELFNKQGELSSIEIAVDNIKNTAAVAQAVKAIVAKQNLKVETRFEQNKTLYYILSSEKWMTYAILALMLFIASFNMIASLSMLALEKRRDISVLKAMGAQTSTITRIFMSTGIGIGLLGAVIGCSIALVVCLLQQHFSLIKMQGDDLLLQAYPIKILWTDFVLVFVTVLIISILACILPSLKASRSQISFRND
jgi:lipoprotein-releasing system permease protein